MTIAALGVVFGDIGTSPLYSVRQSLIDFGDLSERAILGALSLIVWALVLQYMWIMAAGLVGAALFYGDGVITPAISVLSAVEGLKVATPLFEPYVIPISLVLLTGVFLMQCRGTEAVGRLFGPVMLVWFATLALLGGWQVARALQFLSVLVGVVVPPPDMNIV